MITLSERRVGQLLVGKEVALSIGEPWDFESKDGQGALKGQIVEVRRGVVEGRDAREDIVTIEVTPFSDKSSGRVIRHLSAAARYVDEVGIVEHLARGESAEVNFDYSDQVPEALRIPDVYPGLIGGLYLAD